MPDRDKYRLDAVASAEHSADHLLPIQERAMAAALGGWIGIGAREPRLGAADGGMVQQDTQVTGDAHSPRMSDPLAID